MKSFIQAQPLTWPVLAWLTVAVAGCVAPAIAMIMLGGGGAGFAIGAVAKPLLAIGLMGAGMIGAAAGRFWVGIILALLTGIGLISLAQVLGMSMPDYPFSLALAVFIATISFAARGALFARSVPGKGWWIAVFVVAGEAAILFTAVALPGALPDIVLVLLPAQWANMAIESAFIGSGTRAAGAALTALGGTAMVTLLVAQLLPRRWPYIFMFTAWLGLSALVWYTLDTDGPHIGPTIINAI